MILVALLSATLTQIGNFVVPQLVQSKGKPILLKSVTRTDLSGLPQAVRSQIGLVPITYTLQHSAGAAAQNVTISLKSDSLLQINDIKFTPESENHQFSSADLNTLKINVPTIRPGGLVSFQLLTTATNQIKISELADNAQFITGKEGADAQKQKTIYIEYVLVSIGVMIWLALLCTLIVVVVRTGKSWREIETSTAPPEIRKQLIVLIVAIYIYGLLLGSLGPLGVWLPAPRISFNELISAFLFYLLVTRYKLIENWLLAKGENGSASSKPAKPD